MMSLDYTITVGNIIEIIAMLGGGIMVLITLKTDVNMLKMGAQALKEDLALMQSEIKKLSEVLINLADIRGDIKTLSARVTTTEQDIRELRHGHGFVKGIQGVEREYK